MIITCTQVTIIETSMSIPTIPIKNSTAPEIY